MAALSVTVVVYSPHWRAVMVDTTSLVVSGPLWTLRGDWLSGWDKSAVRVS